MATYNSWEIDEVWAGLRFTFSTDVVEELKASIPVGCRKWDPKERCWRIERSYMSIALSILNAYDYEDSIVFEKRQHERRQREKPKPPTPQPQSAASPYTMLFVLPSAPPEVIDAAYRALAKLYHPDRAGGSTQKMKELNVAYDKVKVK